MLLHLIIIKITNNKMKNIEHFEFASGNIF